MFMSRMISQKCCGLFSRLKAQPVSSLYLGLMVCLCGGIAVIANLAVQHVPLAALYAAGTEAQDLAVLSLITLVLCIAGAGVTTAALAQKKKNGA